MQRKTLKQVVGFLLAIATNIFALEAFPRCSSSAVDIVVNKLRTYRI